MMKHFTFLAVICALVLSSCGTKGGGSGSPKKMVENLNGYVKDGNYEKAMRYWTDNIDRSDEKSSKSADELKAQTEQMITLFSAKLKAEVDKHGGIESMEVISETINEDGTQATVASVTTYRDGKTDEQTNKFVKVDGAWKFENSK